MTNSSKLTSPLNALTEDRTPSTETGCGIGLKKAKNGKAPGIDDIPIEIRKANGKESDVLWKLCKLIRRTSIWPTDWSRTIFIPLPKKGNIKKCSNNRTISLICTWK